MSRLFGPGSGSEYVSVKDGEIGIGADAPGDFPANEWPGGSESNVILNFVAGDEITNEYAIDMGDYVGGRLVLGDTILWFVVPVSDDDPEPVQEDYDPGDALTLARSDHVHDLMLYSLGGLAWEVNVGTGYDELKAVAGDGIVIGSDIAVRNGRGLEIEGGDLVLKAGTGQFKVLQMTDAADPGTLGWDYVRCHA